MAPEKLRFPMRFQFIYWLPAVALLVAFGWWLGVSLNDAWTDHQYVLAHDVPTSQFACSGNGRIFYTKTPGGDWFDAAWVNRGIENGYLPSTAQPFVCSPVDAQGHDLANFYAPKHWATYQDVWNAAGDKVPPLGVR
jgi:hypothetical protein